MLEFGHKIDGFEYRERPGAYAIIINNDNKIAIVTRRGGFFLPGGGIEGNESQEECLKRECVEEVGYNIKVGKYIGQAACYAVAYSTKEHLRLIGNFYSAELIDDNCEKVEIDHELLWLDPENAINKMQVKSQSWAIKEYLAHNNEEGFR